MIKNKKSGYAPKGFIQKTGVDKSLAHFGYRLVALHSPPAAAGKAAVCLLIDKVAPSAYALTDQETNRAYIEHIEYVYLTDFTHYGTRNKGAYNAAVNGKPRKARRIAEAEKVAYSGQLFAVEYHIVRPRREYRHRSRDQHHVKHTVGIKSEPGRVFYAVDKRQQEACRDYNAVPVNIPVTGAERNGKRYRRKGQLYAEYNYLIAHFYSSPSCGFMTESTVFSLSSSESRL